ncbi:MAG: TolC family protein [Synergistaceae bacterium]|nr:TolC family protein [Synergistaceae bacterium]
MNITKAFITAALIAASASAAAAASLDIKEAVGITLKENASLRSLRQELIKADAFKLQADGTLLPSISASGTLDRQREPQTTDGSDRSGGSSVSASLEQVIYSGGRNSAMRAQAPQVRTIAEMALADGENSAVGELYVRFYNVLLQKARIEAERDAVATSELHLSEVRKMSEVGLANRLEVIRAGQQLATNTAALATARGLYEAASIALMSYMGIEPKDRLEVEGRLYEPAITGSRAKSLALAEQFRADRKQLEEQLRYQENQIKIERSGMMPTVTAGISSGWSDPYRNQDRGDDTWRAEVTLAVPIFDRNVTRRAVMTARAEREQERIALEQKNIDIKADVETAWNDIETNRENLRASEKALELARESLRLSEVGFREGVTPQLDLLTAQSELTTALLEYNRARYNCIVAAVALKMTEGTITGWNGESL